jgi:hypothetical protein
MTPDSNPRRTPEPLDQVVHRALRELPPRRAPRTLEQRVLAEIARRAALPWWRRSFAHWPAPALAGFVLVSLGAIKLVFLGAGWGAAGLPTAEVEAAMAQPIQWWESFRTVAEALRGTVELMARHIPPLWWYGGLATLAAVYAALFGLGAAAFRMLRSHS